MAGLLFGTAGVPLSSRTLTTQDGISRLAELGLGCLEVEFVQGVRLSAPSAITIGKLAANSGIRLTAHAPYWVNLNSREPEKVAASRQRLLHAARIAALCTAESLAFHAAFYSGATPEQAYEAVKKQLAIVLEPLRKEGNQIWLRPEVSGKASQFGTLDEVLNLSAELQGVAPCIDFAHLHARAGGINTYAEFKAVLDQVQSKLGRQALGNMHLHISGIAYGKKGEKKHLNLKESDLNYVALLRALKEQGVQGFVICESPNLEEDALLMQEIYNALR